MSAACLLWIVSSRASCSSCCSLSWPLALLGQCGRCVARAPIEIRDDLAPRPAHLAKLLVRLGPLPPRQLQLALQRRQHRPLARQFRIQPIARRRELVDLLPRRLARQPELRDEPTSVRLRSGALAHIIDDRRLDRLLPSLMRCGKQAEVDRYDAGLRSLSLRATIRAVLRRPGLRRPAGIEPATNAPNMED